MILTLVLLFPKDTEFEHPMGQILCFYFLWLPGVIRLRLVLFVIFAFRFCWFCCVISEGMNVWRYCPCFYVLLQWVVSVAKTPFIYRTTSILCKRDWGKGEFSYLIVHTGRIDNNIHMHGLHASLHAYTWRQAIY